MFNNNHPQWRGTCALERSGENREDEGKHHNNSCNKKNYYLDARKTVFIIFLSTKSIRQLIIRIYMHNKITGLPSLPIPRKCREASDRNDSNDGAIIMRV